MRNFNTEILKQINQGNAFVFLFDIYLSSGEKIYLTNADRTIKVYKPNSALHIVTAKFNDSSQDELEICGLFEEQGITKTTDLQDAAFNISLFLVKEKITHTLLKLWCSNATYRQMEFSVTLKNSSARLGQSISKIYSKTCRAKLGDSSCCVKLTDFIQTANVISATNNIIITSCHKPNGYYDWGKLRFKQEDNGQSNPWMLILKQQDNCLILQKQIPQLFLDCQEVELLPGCDKTLDTCSSKFANHINFRGEPYITNFTP